jgi:hypothetical protein
MAKEIGFEEISLNKQAATAINLMERGKCDFSQLLNYII